MNECLLCCYRNLQPTHAMFYSINSPIAGLSGLELASHLIKEASKKLSTEFPTISTFSTLSPIPNFMKWLGKISDGQHTAADLQIPYALRQSIISVFANNGSDSGNGAVPPLLLNESGNLTDREVCCWVNHLLLKRASLTASEESPAQMDIIRTLSLGLCARYLTREKTSGGNYIVVDE